MAKKREDEDLLHVENAEAARESSEAEPSVSERLGETADEAGRILRESTENLDETVGRVMDNAERSLGAIGRHVRDQPLASLAIAFLAGMAVIGLMRRR
jgi:hypothetical protein